MCKQCDGWQDEDDLVDGFGGVVDGDVVVGVCYIYGVVDDCVFQVLIDCCYGVIQVVDLLMVVVV